MSAVLAARERERLRQMELEAQRTAEQLAMLEAHLEAARADADKAEVTARRKVSAANERARLAEARAAALEEALATTAMPERPRYALADAEDPPSPHGAVALMGTSLSSPLQSPRGARRGDSAADLVAAMTPPGDARDGREISASPSADGAAAAFAELITWRRPGATARVAFGGLYAQLCVSSLRTMPLPFGTVACYGFMFALAASLLWRLARGLRLVLLGVSSSVGVRKPETLRTESSERARREVRERDARRFAAKFGGWIAASTARRAPAVAMAWLTLERTFAWEHPPTTLKACVALWLASLAARVWRAPADVTALVAWVALFTAPPFVVAFGPGIRAATQMAVGETRARFAYLLDDRRVQLAGLCVAWSAAGLAGRTLLGLAAATMFLTGGGGARRARARRGVERRRARNQRRDHHRAAGQPGDGRGVCRARGGGGGGAVAEEGDHARAPGGGGASPLAGGGAAGARGAGRVPVGGGEARCRRSGRAHAFVVADHERGFAVPAARAGRDPKRVRRRKKTVILRRREVRPDPTRRRRDRAHDGDHAAVRPGGGRDQRVRCQAEDDRRAHATDTG
jgi:hypothetical protein